MQDRREEVRDIVSRVAPALHDVLLDPPNADWLVEAAWISVYVGKHHSASGHTLTPELLHTATTAALKTRHLSAAAFLCSFAACSLVDQAESSYAEILAGLLQRVRGHCEQGKLRDAASTCQVSPACMVLRTLQAADHCGLALLRAYDRSSLFALSQRVASGVQEALMYASEHPDMRALLSPAVCSRDEVALWESGNRAYDRDDKQEAAACYNRAIDMFAALSPSVVRSLLHFCAVLEETQV
eukprot:TRINITY_DN19698_c0_g1_i1.p1 TRINITY_DN19698_c0_g1~~TRINITY_DN19698_c0_g1_i1.p1  ORF type:complete len:242 (+),score=29.84 TRINITY_DN19698_c0_g1_i1:680-1405(+)